MDILRGTVDRFVFRNEENGYTVLRLVQGELTHTAVGRIMPEMLGQEVELTGTWINHRQYGRQFEFSQVKGVSAMSVAGLEKYLGSGMIKGIGPATARRIVSKFGDRVLEILEKSPERLREVAGIGEAKADAIGQAFAERSALRDAMVFLQGHGISPGYAGRIFRQYGEQTETCLRANPYRMADEVHGIGFKTADRLARELGLGDRDSRRIAAGLRFALQVAQEQGHCFLPQEELLARAAELLDIEQNPVAEVLAHSVGRRMLIGAWAGEEFRIYRPEFWQAEKGVAQRVRALLGAGVSGNEVAPLELAQLEEANSIVLAAEQRRAVGSAVENGLSIITGGPGTGKTTLIRILLQLASKRGWRTALAAPTGRASRRMGESAGQEAKTLHRLLEYSVQEGAFLRNQFNPLECDLLVVDEASMVDLHLMHALLLALPDSARLVLVGDVDQLPPVGAGSVFRDLLHSGLVPEVRLQVIYRQAEESAIIDNAHRINRGEFPSLRSKAGDFLFIRAEEPEKAAAILLETVVTRLPRMRKLHPFLDIQVLSPMRRSSTGVDELNVELQARLNPPSSQKPELRLGGRVIRLGDKVMQIRNNYAKMVFNGDVGRVVNISTEDGYLQVSYSDGDGYRRVSYDFSECDEITMAYAISVHKSQGSEYKAVVLPLTTQHFMMLKRNLLYTAVTRARELVVIIGSPKAIAIAVKQMGRDERFSGLTDHLRGDYGS